MTNLTSSDLYYLASNPAKPTAPILGYLTNCNLDAMELTLIEMRNIFQAIWQSSDTLDQKDLLLLTTSVGVQTLDITFQERFDFNRGNIIGFSFV